MQVYFNCFDFTTGIANLMNHIIPSKQTVLLWISKFFILFFIAALLYSVLDKHVLPGSEIFALAVLYALACIGGRIVKCLRLPPLLGDYFVFAYIRKVIMY